MRRFLFVVLALGTLTLARGQDINQSVMATAGKTQDNSTIYLSWTLGELATQSWSNQEGQITEGFHQPILLEINEEGTNTAVELEYSNPNFFLDVTAGPNPVYNVLTVQLSSNREEQGQIDLHDFNGKIQQSHRVNLAQDHIEINMQALAAGMYSVSVYTLEGELLHTLKVTRIEW